MDGQETGPAQRPTSEDIERLLLGAEPRYTPDEVAERAGVSKEFATRVWRALGFASLPDEAVAFTDDDADMLRRVARRIERGLIDEQTAVRMARAMGQTMSRLAQWQADIMIGAELDPNHPPTDEDISRIIDLASKLLPDVEAMLVHVWRVQLAAAGTRSLAVASINEEVPHTRVNMAVGFADLVSFTQMSRELDELALADLIEWFEATAADIVAPYTARIVKSLGDEVLYTAVDPLEGAEIALRLTEVIKGEGPDVRIGVAYGPVLPMMGDVFGSTVNLAARLTAIARPGTVLVDTGLAKALEGAPDYDLHRIRRRPARGFGIVQPYNLRRPAP
ncbi:adenylate/guanylate cyclase domain-containing protein [Bailinhaonella thermotolerans]|uniref:Adenylate/guanylate cyclase domain-containing protein n=1 Tax=Bailinhaonella thermotolerans TaxID=1070861 RepID=A0A3A4AYV9_9ACTN|nr:adenylate/guanylate cyclase domain-containing protein [Bailinhaonella thermotolerans]RJL33569.1 adenylate/guanylate cyclase domain-containing protein [Bailinhaonella thermotolerans]